MKKYKSRWEKDKLRKEAEKKLKKIVADSKKVTYVLLSCKKTQN